MTLRFVVVALLTCCCWSVFSQELPTETSDPSDAECAELKQQIKQLIGHAGVQAGRCGTGRAGGFRENLRVFIAQQQFE